MMFQMACSGRLWTDFVSYDPRLPEDLQLFVVRLNRDDAYIADMETAILTFQATVKKMISDLKSIRP
jgi:hypothetical protein